MEDKIEVKTFEIDYTCDHCETGLMRPSGAVILQNGFQFPHTCNYCGQRENYPVTYPYLKKIISNESD